MIVADLVKISCEILKILSKYDIRVDDYVYIDLYSDYLNMAFDNQKTSYIVSVLAEKYNIGEASVYRILRRFKKSI